MTITSTMSQIHEDEEPNFSDPEDFIDDITDDELLADLLRKKPKETDGMEAVVIVDGIPQVGQDRIDRLKTYIRKLFGKDNVIINEHHPLNADGMTQGYMFIEYKDKATAEAIIANLNNYAFDKQHTLACNRFTDFDRFSNVPEKFEKPKPQPYKDIANLHSFLMDENCYDQFSIIYGSGSSTGTTTAIFSNEVPEPQEVQKRDQWTETYVRWSPNGTYLATFHAKGIALWGGEGFKQIQKFSHPGVQFIDFSPCENYLVTFSPQIDPTNDEPHSIIIWIAATGQIKRSFHCDQPPVWPIFKWSHKDEYFGRITDNLLSIYETESFGLLDKKSMKVAGIKDFSFAPTDNTIAYWIAENKDVPAKVALIAVPSRKEIRGKTLFNVSECNMYWQKCGDHLAVRCARYSKLKKEKSEVRYTGLYYNFEIFHMREKGVPVDSLGPIKEATHHFAWEPVNNKFAIVSGDIPNTYVTFYEVRKGQQPTELKKFDKRPWNTVSWSPKGQFVVLAGLRNMTGSLNFIDTNDFTDMQHTEHFMATDLEWDSTGRYVATSVSWWGHKVDNAYWIWNFQGKSVHKESIEKFCQFLWRPRPALELSSSEEIKKQVRKCSQQFELQDKTRVNKATRERLENRQKLMRLFTAFRKEIQEKLVKEKPTRLALRNGQDTDTLTSNMHDFEEETVVFFVRSETILLE